MRRDVANESWVRDENNLIEIKKKIYNREEEKRRQSIHVAPCRLPSVDT